MRKGGRERCVKPERLVKLPLPGPCNKSPISAMRADTAKKDIDWAGTGARMGMKGRKQELCRSAESLFVVLAPSLSYVHNTRCTCGAWMVQRERREWQRGTGTTGCFVFRLSRSRGRAASMGQCSSRDERVWCPEHAAACKRPFGRSMSKGECECSKSNPLSSSIPAERRRVLRIRRHRVSVSKCCRAKKAPAQAHCISVLQTCQFAVQI